MTVWKKTYLQIKNITQIDIGEKKEKIKNIRTVSK